MNLISSLKLYLSSYLVFLQVSVSLAQNDGRIVGGYSTTIKEAPYLVQIRSRGHLICGGTLVAGRYVVTAAHCFIKKPKDLLVVGGATKLTESGTARSKVIAHIVHNAFDKRTYNMDIAVLKLETPLKGRLIKSMKLGCRSNWVAGQKVKLFGWGELSDSSKSLPLDLQTVEVAVVNKTECTYNYRFQRKITESMVCATAPGKDSCHGDSGGPAIINNQFCGVVSWGSGCAEEAAPGIYTNIRVVEKFIRNSLKKLKKYEMQKNIYIVRKKSASAETY